MANNEADVRHKKEFPDGFLYFARLVEFYTDAGEPVAQQAAMVTRILEAFWASNVPAVAACDDEDVLLHRGGYRSRDVPWPIAQV
ncbi:hypothetical protein [Roseiflexus castenholzii]|uniref:hypothetical protein n=1 Tax=Roseiflexus castenholzii TaxID=120962 RepID=UPI002357DE36